MMDSAMTPGPVPATPPEPLSTTRRLARFETAQEVIGLMATLRTDWIRLEQLKPSPDLRMIQQWQREFSAYADEEDALSFDDTAAIDRAIATYGPIVRAAFQAT